jgi:hypothetical protein
MTITKGWNMVGHQSEFICPPRVITPGVAVRILANSVTEMRRSTGVAEPARAQRKLITLARFAEAWAGSATGPRGRALVTPLR